MISIIQSQSAINANVSPLEMTIKFFKTLCVSPPKIVILVRKVSLQFGFWLPKILKGAHN